MTEKTLAPPLPGPTEAPDFKQVRKYLKEISERERLGEFIRAGWTPAELGEYARSMYLVPGRTYPTAASYEIAVTFGPESILAKTHLEYMRSIGYVLPPFNRPIPPRQVPFDHPEHPEHTAETRADVKQIALCLRNVRAQREQLPPPDPDKLIPPSLWKKCFHMRRGYGSLQEALMRQGLAEYC